MKEMQEILRALESPENGSEILALATVVKVEGSAYRRPGARMLILPDGRRLGSLSGGCLEADVAERARQVRATGVPEMVRYDTRHGFDLVQEMGCQGAVTILIEAIRSSDPYVRFLMESFRLRRRGVLATVVHAPSSGQLRIGARLAYTQEAMFSEIDAIALGAALVQDAAEVINGAQAEIRTYALSEGSVEVLVEPLLLPLTLLICGAGQDALPLAQFATQLGWQVVVTDAQPARLAPGRFPHTVRRLEMHPRNWRETLRPDDRTIAVLMTHNYEQDLELLRSLLPFPLPYLGLLGPRKRGERLLQELHNEGFAVTEPMRERLFSPAGLDIGSETPEEIALAILAEIQQTLTRRPRSPLRQRGAPIHAEYKPKSV